MLVQSSAAYNGPTCYRCVRRVRVLVCMLVCIVCLQDDHPSVFYPPRGQTLCKREDAARTRHPPQYTYCGTR